MKRFDGNCFVGNWPFFRVRENTIDELLMLHKKCGVSGGFISALEAIFYQDPYEAEELLSEKIRGTEYHHVMILNPMLPAWRDDLHRCIKKLRIKGVRLMPGFHGYSLNDSVLNEVINEIEQYDLYFMITLRMQDDRTTWMHSPRYIPMEELADFVNAHKDTKILLNHIRLNELEHLNERNVCWQNLYADTSGFKDGSNPAESAISKDFLKEHIIYGSGAPILEPYASVFQLETANISETEKEYIFSGKSYL